MQVSIIGYNHNEVPFCIATAEVPENATKDSMISIAKSVLSQSYSPTERELARSGSFDVTLMSEGYDATRIHVLNKLITPWKHSPPL